MAIKTITPQVTLSLSSLHLYFRFDRAEGKQFSRKLCLAKEKFPHMLWAQDKKMWQLPICDLKPIYEFCRKQFGVENVHLQYQQYKDNLAAVQLSLFESKQN